MGWVEKQVPFNTIDTYNVFRSCSDDYKFRTKLMLKKGQFYFHTSTPPGRLVFGMRFKQMMCPLALIAASLPDVSFIANLWSLDNPGTVSDTKCYEGLDGNLGYSYCPPPFCNSSLVIPSGDTVRANTHALEKLAPGTPFREKRIVGWRGSLSGHRPMRYDGSPLWRTTTARQLLLNKCSRDSRMDCAVVNGSRRLSHVELQNSFRGLIAVAGYSYAGNFADALYYHDTVPLRQDVPAVAWYEPFFEADKHYLALNRNLSDLEDKVNALFDIRSTDRMLAISENGRQRAKHVFSYEFQKQHFTSSFMRYARALRGSFFDDVDGAWKPVSLSHCPSSTRTTPKTHMLSTLWRQLAKQFGINMR